MTPQELWERFAFDAEWEVTDRPDDYTQDCSIYLEVDGYTFEGWGYITCGEKDIQELECTTPEGKKIQII